MSKLIVMVGLPGSGKSHLAHNLARKENAIILSSDKVRKKLYGDENDQTKNREVFEMLNKQAKKHLQNGQSIIYDATNINRKRRVHLINHELNLANEKVVYYMNTDFATCIDNDNNRERQVGEAVISKMLKTMQIPVKNEGWDKVNIISGKREWIKDKTRTEKTVRHSDSHDNLMGKLAKKFNDFNDIYDLPQDSKYHSFSVSRHTYHVYNYVKENKSSLRLLYAALFHDIGKGFCKSFVNYKGENTRYANFIGHEYVGGQISMYYLHNLGYDNQFIQDVSSLVQFHMYPLNASDKKMNEIKRLLGDKLYSDLLILHEADKQAK